MTDIGPDIARRVLAAQMPDNDANAHTIGDYLIALLAKLWCDEADLSGKHPFGNAGWQHEVYEALFRDGFDVGTTDEAGVRDVDVQRADALVCAAIAEFGKVAADDVVAVHSAQLGDRLDAAGLERGPIELAYEELDECVQVVA